MKSMATHTLAALLASDAMFRIAEAARVLTPALLIGPRPRAAQHRNHAASARWRCQPLF